MNYNFDKEINRRGTNSYKWDSRPDVPENIIPLWVADMDFQAAPAILNALKRRVEFGIFGYTFVPDAFYAAATNWFERRHNWKFSKEQVIYTSGVVPAISAIIKALCQPGDKVLIQTPVYNCFFSSIRNNGCIAHENKLILKGNRYEIDFDDLEEKAKDPDCTLMLLCNPHNPAGRVWTREELQRICEICQRHNVTVVSDEIHCELVFKDYEYTPFATVAAQMHAPWVACVSPSKAFNIAGLQIALIVMSDDVLRAKIDRAININEVCDVNPFGVDALIAAYNESEDWLDQLLPYIRGNYELLCEKFSALAPGFTVIQLEGTYLAWVDCRSIDMDSVQLEEYLIHSTGVWVNAGSMYGAAGEGFIRINLACPRHRLEMGLDRMLPELNKLCLKNK